MRDTYRWIFVLSGEVHNLSCIFRFRIFHPLCFCLLVFCFLFLTGNRKSGNLCSIFGWLWYVPIFGVYLSMLLQKWILMLMPVAAGQMACRRAAGRMAGWSGAVQTTVLNRTLLNLRPDFIGTSLSELCFCVGQCSCVDHPCSQIKHYSKWVFLLKKRTLWGRITEWLVHWGEFQRKSNGELKGVFWEE